MVGPSGVLYGECFPVIMADLFKSWARGQVVALIAGILFLLIRVLLARRPGTGASEQTTSQLTEDP